MCTWYTMIVPSRCRPLINHMMLLLCDQRLWLLYLIMQRRRKMSIWMLLHFQLMRLLFLPTSSRRSLSKTTSLNLVQVSNWMTIKNHLRLLWIISHIILHLSQISFLIFSTFISSSWWYLMILFLIQCTFIRYRL